jgi:mannose-6-phosphate isomerase
MLFQNDHFWAWRTTGEAEFAVGGSNEPTVLVCLDGRGHVEHGRSSFVFEKGNVMLLPAALGECVCLPSTSMTVLEIAIPEAR